MPEKRIKQFLQNILFLLIGLTTAPCWAEKYDSSLEWKTYETEHFVFHYDKNLRHLTERLAPKSEQVHKTLSEYFDWQPGEKTHVVLTDKIDATNGTATVMFSNSIVLYTSPPYEPFGLEDFDNWLELVFIHEYTHILHLDMSGGLPKHLRWILGRFYLLFPNAFMPRWLVEGIATYIETDEKTDSGRGNSTYFRALMRMEIENGFLSAGNVSQIMESWPGLTRWYLYGVYWFKFLEEKYGQDKIIELLKHQGSFPIPYLPDVGSWLALDKTLVSLWPEFEFYIQKQFSDEIATLKENQWQAGENISESGYGNRNPIFINDKNLLYVANDGIDSSWLTRYDIEKKSHSRIRRVYGHRF
ncbi:MAG: hypothetical protein OEX19_06570, partial [Gammaproteobacteria bacterium]|nr:hypothetical protein [Gammaproteobacteria bacterium]